MRAIRKGVKAVERLPRLRRARHLPLQRRALRQHHDHQPLRRAPRLHAATGTRRAGRQRAAGQRRLGDRHRPRHLTLDDLPERYRAPLRGGRRDVTRAAASRAWASSLPRLAPAAPGLGAPRGRGRPALPGRVAPPARATSACSSTPASTATATSASRRWPSYIQHRLGINVEFQGPAHRSRSTCATAAAACSTPCRSLAALLQPGEARVGHGRGQRGQHRPPPRPRPTPTRRAARRCCSTCRPRAGVGFGAFAFQTRDEHAELFTSVVSLAVPRGRLVMRRGAELEEA